MVAFKNRYMVFEVFVEPHKKRGKNKEAAISKFDISKAIRGSLHANFGEYGLAASVHALQVKYFNPITKLCIVRGSRMEYQKVWCAITLVKSVGPRSVSFNLLDLSGNIKACKRIALQYDKAKFEQYKLVERNDVPEEILQRVNTYFEEIENLDG